MSEEYGPYFGSGHALNGIRILENQHLMVPGEPHEERHFVRRTWRDRLFSLPWRPLQRERVVTRTVTPMMPSKEVYKLPDGSFVMHPETARALRAAIH